MENISHEAFRKLLEVQEGPCLTLYVPGESGGGATRIRWKNQVNEAIRRWEGQSRGEEGMKTFFDPLVALQEDIAFWRGAGSALAAYRTPHSFDMYRVPMDVEEATFLGDRFCVKPLLPFITGDGGFYILALSQNNVRLWRATRWTISPVEVAGMPKNFEDAMKFTDRDEPLNFHTEKIGNKWAAIFHGHGVGIDDHKTDLLAYFRMIDAAMHRTFREEKAPLVLATVAPVVPLYREANTYAGLAEAFVAGNPERKSPDELRDEAYAAIRPDLEEPFRRELERYRAMQGVGYTSRDFAEVLPAAMNGEIATLFVPMDRTCWGRYERDGLICTHEAQAPDDEDLYDRAAHEMLRRGRAVYAVKAAEIPGGASVAAIRFAPMAKHGKRPGASVVNA
ncbi:MAG: hypothetical protein U0744_16870 [Gemmataceae bacterium]